MKKTWLFTLPWDILYPGGVNQVVINLINTFQKTSCVTPKLLITQKSGTLNNIANAPIEYFPLTNPCWSPGVSGIIKYLIKLPVLLFKLHYYIDNSITCINPHYPTLDVINFILYKKFGFYKGIIILSFHGTDIISLKKITGFEKHLWNFIFQHVDHMVCCSQALADELIAFLNHSVICNKISIIHNGIDEQRLNTELDDSNAFPAILKNSRFILNVATYEKNKCQNILIHAFAKIRKSINPIKLVLIGRSTDVLINYRQLVRQLECENEVIFFENMEHAAVLTFFQRADVFCLPSRYESFGIVLLEAGFYSCPIIASNVGGIPEIIDNGYDGYLVEPENIDELANKLAYLLNNDYIAQQMGCRLREKVVKKFTWHHSAEKYLHLLPSALKPKQADTKNKTSA